jgi:hypothetical protein
VNDTGRDVNERTLGDGLLGAIENDTAAAIKHVVKLSGAFVVMELGPVNVHRMHPSCRRCWRILVTDEPIPPTAGTALSRRVPFMAN